MSDELTPGERAVSGPIAAYLLDLSSGEDMALPFAALGATYARLIHRQAPHLTDEEAQGIVRGMVRGVVAEMHAARAFAAAAPAGSA